MDWRCNSLARQRLGKFVKSGMNTGGDEVLVTGYFGVDGGRGRLDYSTWRFLERTNEQIKIDGWRDKKMHVTDHSLETPHFWNWMGRIG
jgi:hypothetical protein